MGELLTEQERAEFTAKHPAFIIAARLVERDKAQRALKLMHGDPYAGHDPEFVKEHMRVDRDQALARFNDILETANSNTRNITKTTPLNVRAEPLGTLLDALAGEPLSSETRTVKRNLNVVWGTIAFGIIAHEFKWPEKITALGMEFKHSNALMWALIALITYHLVYFGYYFYADARRWFSARRIALGILKQCEATVAALGTMSDLATPEWVAASQAECAKANRTFLAAHGRLVLDFVLPVLCALATALTLLVVEDGKPTVSPDANQQACLPVSGKETQGVTPIPNNVVGANEAATDAGAALDASAPL